MRGWCWRSSLIIHYYPLSILPTRILKPPLLPNEQEERIKRERPRIPLWVKQHYVGPWGKRSDIQYMAIPQNIAKYSKHSMDFTGTNNNKHKNIRVSWHSWRLPRTFAQSVLEFTCYRLFACMERFGTLNSHGVEGVVDSNILFSE